MGEWRGRGFLSRCSQLKRQETSLLRLVDEGDFQGHAETKTCKRRRPIGPSLKCLARAEGGAEGGSSYCTVGTTVCVAFKGLPEVTWCGIRFRLTSASSLSLSSSNRIRSQGSVCFNLTFYPQSTQQGHHRALGGEFSKIQDFHWAAAHNNV